MQSVVSGRPLLYLEYAFFYTGINDVDLAKSSYQTVAQLESIQALPSTWSKACRPPCPAVKPICPRCHRSPRRGATERLSLSSLTSCHVYFSFISIYKSRPWGKAKSTQTSPIDYRRLSFLQKQQKPQERAHVYQSVIFVPG